MPKEELHTHINTRVDEMIENKLIDEVRGLQPFERLNALRTVGYSEIFDYIDGKISLELAINDIKTNTRQYAKRQLTWFRKDKEIKWLSPGDMNKIISMANEFHESRKDEGL